MSELETWLTVREVAATLKISDTTVIRRCESGFFQTVINVGTAKRKIFRIAASSLLALQDRTIEDDGFCPMVERFASK